MITINKYKVKNNSLTDIFITVIIAILMMSLTSCEIETSDNGKLDGFWHLERVDSLNNGKTADYSNKKIFWGVQLRLIETTDHDNNAVNSLYMRFKQTADSIYINNVYENHWHEDNNYSNIGGDIPIETPNNDTRHYGINNIPEGFLKERLDGSKMVLKSKTLRMTFCRF